MALLSVGKLVHARMVMALLQEPQRHVWKATFAVTVMFDASGAISRSRSRSRVTFRENLRKQIPQIPC